MVNRKVYNIWNTTLNHLFGVAANITVLLFKLVNEFFLH
jgi:hypothetical protein